jgi:scyllo-inositol 2-dehydrogenase (NADP+)
MAVRQVRIAIIGQGRSGRNNHGRYLNAVPKMYKIVAAVDPLEERRNRAKTEFGCDVYEDYRSLFERKDIDIVLNSTPSHLHYPVTKDLLERGFNVLCEKPLARRVEEVDDMIETSKKSGKLLAIFQQARFGKTIRKTKEILESGVLGRIVNISFGGGSLSRRWDWQTLQEYNGGSLLNTGPHVLDRALSLFGFDIMPDVTCVMDRANTFGDAEDYVKLMLRAPGRPVVELEISSCCPYRKDMLNVQATRGGLKMTNDDVEWKYFIPEEAPKQKLTREPINNPEGLPAYCSEKLKIYEEKWEKPEN